MKRIKIIGFIFVVLLMVFFLTPFVYAFFEALFYGVWKFWTRLI